MWRSTRSKVHSKLCSGADPNRNFDFKWMQVPGGASAVKCSYTYAGPHALSEVETKTTDNYLKEHSKEFDVYLAFHSYSQLILLSYGDGEKPENYDEQLAIAEESAEWISRRFGTIYEVGNTKEILYATSGTSSDHALYVYGIPVSYTYEMRPAGGEFS